MKLGSRVVASSSGKHTIAIATRKGVKHIRKSYIHVPELSKNLISVSQLMKNGYNIHFEGNTCTIYYPFGIETLSIPIKDKIFVLNWCYTSHHAQKAKASETYLLQHKRLGHSSS